MARGNRWGTRKLRAGEKDTSPAVPKWLQTVFNTLDIRDVVANKIVAKDRTIQGNAGNLPVFSGEGLRQAESNLGMLYNQIRKFQGSSLDYYMSGPTTYSIAAGALMRGVSLLDISAGVITESGEEGTYPIFKGSEVHLEMFSTKVFTVHPFIVTLEDGETLTAVDYNGSDPIAAMISMFGAGDYVFTTGPISQARMNDACTFFTARVDLGYELLSNLFSSHYSKAELRETTALKLFMGMILCGVNSQTITASGGYYNLFSLQNRSWGDLG